VACYVRSADDPGLRRAGEALARDLVRDRGRPGREYDLIGGVAGTIIGLLGVTDVFDPDLIEPFCVRLGEHLVAGAEVEAVGLSWPSGAARGGNLCGLGHGAAGIGWSLLELSRRTGRGDFRTAAEEAFAYEESWFDPEASNWPDLRNSELASFQYENRMHELDALVGAGGPVPLYEPKYMTAWCHGAAGIGMSRARAFELLGREEYRAQAQAAARATAETLVQEAPNHSLCHGLVGNASAQLYMARTLGWKQAAREITELLRSVARSVGERGGRWIPGGPDREHPDPTLMLGEAGIGLALLDLEHEVISPLFPAPRHQAPPPAVSGSHSAPSVVETILLRAYPNTVSALNQKDDLGNLSPEVEGDAGARIPAAIRLQKLLRERASEAPPGTEVLEGLQGDILALERARRRFDRSFLLLCQRFPVRGVDDEQGVALAPWIEIAHRSGRAWLLYPSTTGQWKARRLSAELNILLEGCRGIRTPAEVARRLARSSDTAPEALLPWVRAQMQALAKAGILISGTLAAALGGRQVEDGGGGRKANAEETTATQRSR